MSQLIIITTLAIMAVMLLVGTGLALRRAATRRELHGKALRKARRMEEHRRDLEVLRARWARRNLQRQQH